jgi:hypothetical protein
MSDANVVEFPSRLHEVSMEQVLCGNCGSRAMRLVSEEGDKYGWEVECHNCGDELVGLKVLWERGSDT